MTKHRKHSQTIKALQKQSEINLSGNYLREKSLIDSLSCKIEEKFSLTNVIPAKNVRGVPMFTDLIYQAIAQAKNYKALLQQDAVKRKFAQEGIEYFEPEINIIVGKKSGISTAQWRRMIADHRGDVKIRTYDEFFKEASYRSNLY